MAADDNPLSLAYKIREKVDWLIHAVKEKKRSWIKKDIIEATAFLKILGYKEGISSLSARTDRLLEEWNSKRTKTRLFAQPKTVIELYKAVAPFYAKSVSNMLFEIEEPVIKKMLPKLKGMQVLDVGCGTGRWTSKFTAKGAQVTGVDINKSMLKIAKYIKKAKFQVMDSRKLKFSSETFDFVFESLMLCHLHDWKKAVKEMIRVCKPCGLILLSDFNGARIFGKQTDVPFSISKTKTVNFPIFPIMPSEIIDFALKNGCELIAFKEPKQKLPKAYIERFHYQPPLQIIMLRKKR
jgi:ubiquinone/menaquinone biosynthesis C-methylase UbiE